MNVVVDSRSKTLNMLSVVLMERYLGQISSTEVFDVVKERLVNLDVHIVQPIVDVNVKNYITVQKIREIVEVFEEFIAKDDWSKSELRDRIELIGIVLD